MILLSRTTATQKTVDGLAKTGGGVECQLRYSSLLLLAQAKSCWEGYPELNGKLTEEWAFRVPTRVSVVDLTLDMRSCNIR